MLKVITCIGVEHDMRLVGLAGLFCLVSSLTAFGLHARGLAAGPRGRMLWVVLTGLTAGSGIWATHFTAMLAYAPAVTVGFEPLGTLASLLIAVIATGAAFLVSSPRGKRWSVLAGLLFGAGVAGMHYCGMAAFQPAAQILWDPQQMVASVMLGAALGVAAMLAFRDHRSTRDHMAGAALLTLAICSLHFTGMSAVTLQPDPSVAQPLQLLSREQMLAAVGTLTAIVLASGLALVAVDLQSRRRSSQNLELLFERNPASMWLLEPQTLRFLAVNDAAVRDYGYSHEDFARMTVFDILAPADREAAHRIAVTQLTYESDRVWRHIRADGAEMLVQPYMQTLPYRGVEARLVALFDVTERERAAEALAVARDEAQAANRAKTDFLANMSHEIRTPLNGVLGMAQAMGADDLSAPQRERLAVLRRSGQVLLTLLNDMLDLSKIEAGRLELESIAFDLEQTARSAFAPFAELAKQKGLHFVLDIAPEAAGVFRGDVNRVCQVFTNLASNAVKFTERGEVVVQMRYDDGVLLLRVRDTGVGIPPSVLPELFDKFVQADASTTRRFGGSGLGLAICRELAGLMNGTISVESVQGTGSTFELRLSLERLVVGTTPFAVPAEAPIALPQVGGPIRVLVAEDNVVNQLVMRTLLRQAGIEPEIVANGALALEAWKREAWDVILLDVQMPEMDGPTAARAIRELEAAGARARTPILAVTANAMTHQQAHYLGLGMDGVVAKPIQVEQLFRSLELALACEGPAVAAAA